MDPSNSQPRVPYAPPSSVKRKGWKPTKFGVSQSNMQKEHPPPLSIVQSNPSGPSSSFHREKSPPKGFKTVKARAVEMQRSLGTEAPSCIKMMTTSQVRTGFWLGLPLKFCNLHMPKEDVKFLLEDENGNEFAVKYIAKKSGISGGWKNFVLQHNLVVGDVLVFQLVEHTKFKVYILRDNHDSSEAGTEQTQVTVPPRIKKHKHPQSLSSFQDELVKDFHVMVKGLCIDGELSSDVRTGYYKLCFKKKEFLHDDLPDGLYYKLVASMITQVVSISNKIRNSKLNTAKELFEAWDNTLKSYELLGMKVGFLRDKIHTVTQLVFESEGALDIKEYVETKSDHKRVEDELMKVEPKFKELKEAKNKFEGKLGSLKRKVEPYKRKLQEEVECWLR